MNAWSAVVTRLVLLAAVWWALTEGRAGYWGYGALLVPTALGISLWLLPARTPKPPLLRRTAALAGLLGWFARRALAGGTDVALRALRRPVQVEPRVVRVRVALPPGAAREVALGMVGLMPGTLVQHCEADRAEIHALAADLPVVEQWDELQRRVAAVSGAPSSTPDGV